MPRAQYAEALRHELIDELESGGCTNEDLLDAFYLAPRMRRWFGAGEELGEAFRIYPLCSLAGVRAAFALGPIRRRAETLHFEIMRSACDELVRLPFANATWPAGATAGLEDADADRYRQPAQEAMPGAPVQWQTSRLTDNKDVLTAYLLDEPTNPVFEIVDRNAVEKLLTAPELPPNAEPQSLYGVLTAAIWLGHHETPTRHGAPPA